MRLTRRDWLAGGLATGLAAGCGTAPPPPAGTGAREAALAYFRAVVGRDWSAAHAALDPDSRRQVPAGRFAALAGAYLGGIGFTPTAAQVTACDEQGDRAVAHVVLTGRTSAHQRYKDTTSLRRGPDGWGVVLAAHFGRPRGR